MKNNTCCALQGDVAVLMGASTALAAVPILAVVNTDLRSSQPALPFALAGLAGLLASVTGSNIKARAAHRTSPTPPFPPPPLSPPLPLPLPPAAGRVQVPAASPGWPAGTCRLSSQAPAACAQFGSAKQRTALFAGGAAERDAARSAGLGVCRLQLDGRPRQGTDEPPIFLRGSNLRVLA